MSDFFIGRQPILDDRGQIFAYEILFRSQGSVGASVTDNAAATARVLINVLQNFGVESLLGGKRGFINADESIIMEGALDILPKDKFVIEILETTKITDEVIERVKKYISEGYVFALDDLEFTKEYFDTFKELFPIVDYIKVDYMLSDKAALAKNFAILKRFKAKMLAEKVETQQEYEQCKEMGFHLFQGYYFSKPVVIQQKAVDPSKAATIQLINMLRNDEDAGQLEKVIKSYPDLYINMLKFMNSSAFFTRGTITSIKHAMAMMGRANLSKWLYLVLYAGPNNDSFNNPVLLTAQMRAKTMEKLCEKSRVISHKSDSAYLVGLMSLLDAVFQKELSEIVKEFNVDKEIKDAVTEGKGELGLLLNTVRYYETDSMDNLIKCFDMLKIGFDDFNEIMLESFDWTDKFREGKV